MKPTHTSPAIFESTLRLLEDLTTISSPSGNLDGLEAAAHLLGNALEERGLKVEIRSERDAAGGLQPVLYAAGPAAAEGCLLLIGHLDTVLEAQIPERRGDRLWATGAIDMKGGLATLVGALDLLAEKGRKAPADLLLIVVPDEEVAGRLTRLVVEENGPRARGLWVLEPGQPQEGGESMVIGRRGMFHWQLEVTGTGAHSGNGYWQGRSALDAAAEWCLAARELAQKGQGPTINAGRLVAGETSFVDHLATNSNLVGTTRQINVVPNRARVEGESRFLRRRDGETLPRELERLAEEIGTRRKVEMRFQVHGGIPPLEPQAASRTWAQRATLHAAEDGWNLSVEEDRGGISFSNFLPDPGSIPILDGLGPVGGGMHTRQEFIDLGSLDRRIKLLAELLAAADQET
jgi:glutamate carboxypeptidase